MPRLDTIGTRGPWWFTQDKDGTYTVGAGDTELAKGITSRADAVLMSNAPRLLESLAWVWQYVSGVNDDLYPGTSDKLKRLLGNHCWSTMQVVLGKVQDDAQN